MTETRITYDLERPLNNERKKNWVCENQFAKACLSPNAIGMSLPASKAGLLLRALSNQFFRAEFTGRAASSLTSLHTLWRFAAAVKTESMGSHGLSGKEGGKYGR